MAESFRIVQFVFDEENEEKAARHGLTRAQLEQILGNQYVRIRNRRNRRGQYLIIGVDDGGACIAVPIEALPTFGFWRPVTAWRCKESEERRLRGEGR